MVGYGDSLVAGAVVENLVAAGHKVNVFAGRTQLWENCDKLDKSITRENADYVIATDKGFSPFEFQDAEGNIVDGNEKEQVAGDRFASIIEKVRKDTDVKAVVLRVNSPGGSVMASEKIKGELDLLMERVPVIASYGDYAASGG